MIKARYNLYKSWVQSSEEEMKELSCCCGKKFDMAWAMMNIEPSTIVRITKYL